MKIKLRFVTLCLCCIVSFSIRAQDRAEVEKPKLNAQTFKDPEDGKLDLSRFLIEYHGFIPVVQLITEPALGHIGVMFTPLFIEPNKHQEKGKYTPPNITSGFVGYTANKTWGFGITRSASLPQVKMKYRVGAAYGDVNMDFYRKLPLVGESKFSFNMDMTGGFAAVLRQVDETQLYAGLEYFILHSKVQPEFKNEPDFIKNAIEPHLVSSLGLTLDFDKRDNVFTPNKGLYITADYRMSANWTGSDYTFDNFHFGYFQYLQLHPKWVCGFRFESLMQFGDAPFYMEPGIDLRGVPAARYQGNQSYVVETEQRVDVWNRWSLVGFTGLGKAPTDNQSFSEVDLVYNYGTGFRYLLAKKFNLRAGIDIAKSNNDFGWYIVLGTVWNDRS